MHLKCIRRSKDVSIIGEIIAISCFQEIYNYNLIFTYKPTVKNVTAALNMSASRRFTFREVCNHHGIADDEMIVEDETEAKDDMQLDVTENDEDMEEQLGAIDDEGDIEVAMEGDDEDDEDNEDLSPAATNSDTDIDDDGENLLSSNGLLYTSRSILARRRIGNVLTQSSRGIATPQNELESFEHFLSEGIPRTILMHTNRKVRQIRRSISRSRIAKIFSMDELKADLAIILRAGSDRDNFTELANLWVPADSKPFYRAVMSNAIFAKMYQVRQLAHTRRKKNIE